VQAQKGGSSGQEICLLVPCLGVGGSRSRNKLSLLLLLVWSNMME
jgi:hypothetical protein